MAIQLWARVGLYNKRGRLRYRLRVNRPSKLPEVVHFQGVIYVLGVRVDPLNNDAEYYEASVMTPTTAFIIEEVPEAR